MSNQQPNVLRRTLVVIGVIGAMAAALAVGVLWHEPIHRAFHGHSHSHGTTGPADAKQLWTCGMHPQVIREEPGLCPICQMKLEPLDVVKSGQSAMTGGDAGAANAIRIDPVIVQNMGVRVAEVRRGPVRQEIRAVGYLEEAQPLVHDVNLRVSGWVEKLHADTEGVHLSKGDPLFELYSPEIQVALEELVAARRSAAAAGGDELSRRTAQALLDAARRKLLFWGLGEREVDRLAGLDAAPRTVTFTSPMTGHVTQKFLVEGAAVKAGDKVLQIVDHSTLWLDAQVFPQDAALIRVGHPVTAVVEGVGGEPFTGEVIFVHPHVDPTTRTARVRMAVPNPEMNLRPGMYATAKVEVELTDKAMLVPREAVIDTGTRQVAFVARGEGHFELRAVKVGAGGEDATVQVLEGLKEGERVVTSGQFLLDAESRMREAVEKHLSERLIAGAPGAPGPDTLPAASAPVRVEGIDPLFEEYLKIQNVLGAPQTSDEPLDVAALVSAAGKVAEGAKGEPARVSRRAAQAAAAMRDKPLEKQRELFAALSDAMVALADVAPPTRAVSERLYVDFCPMAFDNRGAQWIQADEGIANPYYATAMKSCGEVKRRIEAIASPR